MSATTAVHAEAVAQAFGDLKGVSVARPAGTGPAAGHAA
jgi:hypothetical protein